MNKVLNKIQKMLRNKNGLSDIDLYIRQIKSDMLLISKNKLKINENSTDKEWEDFIHKPQRIFYKKYGLQCHFYTDEDEKLATFLKKINGCNQ